MVPIPFGKIIPLAPKDDLARICPSYPGGMDTANPVGTLVVVPFLFHKFPRF